VRKSTLTVTLTAGEVLKIIVGGSGGAGANGYSGGGGGTFVLETFDGAGTVTQHPLLIAGGGGDGSYASIGNGGRTTGTCTGHRR